MKKICTLLIILILVFAFVGCSALTEWGIIGDNNSNIGDNNNNNSNSQIGNNQNQNPPIVGEDDEKPSPKPDVEDTFNDYGFPVIAIQLKLYTITEYGLYTSKEEVGGYIFLFHKLPGNFYTKNDRVSYTSQNKASVGGDRFYNREGILPNAAGRTFTECDIDYKGGNRNSKRIVYSSDWLIFYTSDHYASFSILRFYVS